MPVKRKPTCESCKHATTTDTALICHRYPPAAVVIDNKPVTMRVSVQPGESCGEYSKRAA